MADGNPRRAEHDRCRAILFGRQLDGTLDLGFFQATAHVHKMQVDFGEHLGIFSGALGLQKRFTALTA